MRVCYLFCIIATLTGTIVSAVQAGETATVVLDSGGTKTTQRMDASVPADGTMKIVP